MKIYEALKKDHETVMQLFAQLLSLPDDDKETRSALVKQIRDELVPHSRAEESVFYNTLRSFAPSKDLAMHGFKEHMEAEGHLRLLQVQSAAGMEWRETAQKLQQELAHHIAEEEGTMFSIGRNFFSDEEAEMMGASFERLKPEIREEGVMGTTMDMIANLMPPRFANSFKNTKL